MSNAHLDAIREAMENAWTGDDEGHVVVMAHAEALAAQVERLQQYGALWEDDVRETMQRGADDPYVETTIRQMRRACLQPGDMPGDGSN